MNTTPDKKLTPMGELYAKFNSNNTVSELFEWIYDNKARLLEAEREYASQQAQAMYKWVCSKYEIYNAHP